MTLQDSIKGDADAIFGGTGAISHREVRAIEEAPGEWTLESVVWSRGGRPAPGELLSGDYGSREEALAAIDKVAKRSGYKVRIR